MFVSMAWETWHKMQIKMSDWIAETGEVRGQKWDVAWVCCTHIATWCTTHCSGRCALCFMLHDNLTL